MLVIRKREQLSLFLLTSFPRNEFKTCKENKLLLIVSRTGAQLSSQGSGFWPWFHCCSGILFSNNWINLRLLLLYFLLLWLVLHFKNDPNDSQVSLYTFWYFTLLQLWSLIATDFPTSGVPGSCSHSSHRLSDACLSLGTCSQWFGCWIKTLMHCFTFFLPFWVQSGNFGFILVCALKTWLKSCSILDYP